MPSHFQRWDNFRPNSNIINFPESELGIAAPLNKYLNYVYLLGDPHLGRKFTAGVPLDRRGDRELMIMQQFHDEVVALRKGRYYHVTMGDLFDGWDVNNESIHFAYETYRLATVRNPDVEYFIIAGNHDLSRDNTKVSAFHIFAEMVRDLDNVHVVIDNIRERKVDDLNFLFVPYHPHETSVEFLKRQSPKCLRKGEKFIALGHWDVEDYGRDPNETLGLVPWELFTPDLCEGVITGHDHNRRRIVVNDVEVFIVGSMQPYAHGQDDAHSEDPMYLTLTKSEVVEKLEADPDTFKDKCLRVILEDGEDSFADVNCLQLQFKRNIDKKSTDAILDVKVDDFSLHGLFHAVMDEKKVSQALTAELWQQL